MISRPGTAETKEVDTQIAGHSAFHNAETFGTVYVVLTVSMRYSDNWLVVSAHEPGGVQACRVQLHPTYFAKLCGMSLLELADLPAGDGRDARLEPILATLRASHKFSTAGSGMNHLAALAANRKRSIRDMYGNAEGTAQLLARARSDTQCHGARDAGE